MMGKRKRIIRMFLCVHTTNPHHGYHKDFTDWWDFADWVKQQNEEGSPVVILKWEYV